MNPHQRGIRSSGQFTKTIRFAQAWQGLKMAGSIRVGAVAEAFRCPRAPPTASAMMPTVQADLQPQLWVENTASAVDYYQRAFGAVIEHRVGDPDDVDGVIQLSLGRVRFWVSGASEQMRRFAPAAIGGATGRFLMVVDDPAAVSEAAVAAGARLTSEVAEEHGWLVGRVVDPFGHEWEIGRPLGDWPPHA